MVFDESPRHDPPDYEKICSKSFKTFVTVEPQIEYYSHSKFSTSKPSNPKCRTTKASPEDIATINKLQQRKPMDIPVRKKRFEDEQRVQEPREWETLHRDIIRCLVRHLDPCQLPELRLLNKHWCLTCDLITTRLSISNHAVNFFGSPTKPLDIVTQRFVALQSLVVWKLNPQDAFMLSRMKALTLLDLGGTFIDDDNLRHISSLTKLTALQLWETDVGDTGVGYLSELKNLASLSLRDSKVGDEAMQSIACLTNLTSLDLDRTLVGDKGALNFVHLRRLQRLSLWYTAIGDCGVSYLSHLTELTRLNIGFTKVTPHGLVYLSELAKLVSLELWGIRKPQKPPSHEDAHFEEEDQYGFEEEEDVE